MATQNHKPSTSSTAQKDQGEKIEGLREAAKQQDKGLSPTTPAGAPPAPPSGKGEKRLFQVTPDEKVWMDEAEATKRGFFWKPDPDTTPQKKK